MLDRQETLNFQSLKGHLWATGATEEDAFHRAEDALGKEWFSITAFPLFAGTFGPIATALNICAVIIPWRCVLNPNDNKEDLTNIDDPAWLIAVNVVALVFGIIANTAIIFVKGETAKSSTKRRLRMVLTTVVAGMLASFILIGLVVAASLTLRLPSPPSHAFTGAYYYAIMAAGLYFITSTFVVYTAYMLWQSHKTPQQISNSFSITSGHRSLKLLTVIFMTYLLLGALIFSKIEGWRYLDGLFWADVTILTIGFGDFQPVTHLGRSLLIPYAAFGIFILFLVIYGITQVVFERGKSLWEVEIRDRERIRILRQREERNIMKTGASSAYHSGKLLGTNQVSDQNNVGHSTDAIANLEKLPGSVRKISQRENRRRDFEAMKQILRTSQKRKIWYSLATWAFFSIFLWFFGATMFFICEREEPGWSYFEALYFTYISILAIGYSDYNLQSMPGKAIFVLWSLIVVPSLTMLFTTGSEAVGIPTIKGAYLWVKLNVFRVQEPPKNNKWLCTSIVRIEALPHNKHDKNHLLIQAIKSIACAHIKHTSQNSKSTAAATADEYGFEDWEYIFYLMDVLGNDDPRPDSNDTAVEASEKAARRTELQHWKGGEKTQGRGPDWLHGKNPLNVSETLTEWMLLTLVEKLEVELGDLRKQLGNTPDVE